MIKEFLGWDLVDNLSTSSSRRASGDALEGDDEASFIRALLFVAGGSHDLTGQELTLLRGHIFALPGSYDFSILGTIGSDLRNVLPPSSTWQSRVLMVEAMILTSIRLNRPDPDRVRRAVDLALHMGLTRADLSTAAQEHIEDVASSATGADSNYRQFWTAIEAAFLREFDRRRPIPTPPLKSNASDSTQTKVFVAGDRERHEDRANTSAESTRQVEILRVKLTAAMSGNFGWPRSPQEQTQICVLGRAALEIVGGLHAFRESDLFAVERSIPSVAMQYGLIFRLCAESNLVLVPESIHGFDDQFFLRLIELVELCDDASAYEARIIRFGLLLKRTGFSAGRLLEIIELKASDLRRAGLGEFAEDQQAAWGKFVERLVPHL